MFPIQKLSVLNCFGRVTLV